MNNKQIKTIKSIIALAVVLAFVVYINTHTPGKEIIEQYVGAWGYVGIFVFGAISGFNLLFPVPLIAFFPYFLTIGLHPVLLIITISAGMVFGDLLGYVIGHSTRNLLNERERHPYIKKLELWAAKGPWHAGVLMFLYASFAPAPNELLVIPLAFLRVRWWIIGVAVFLGNIIFNTIGAFGTSVVF